MLEIKVRSIGRRSALVISNTLFNEKTGLVIVCLITKTDRKIPFHIKVDKNKFVSGFVITEQVKSVDFSSRKVKYLYKAPVEMMEEVLAVLHACVFYRIEKYKNFLSAPKIAPSYRCRRFSW